VSTSLSKLIYITQGGRKISAVERRKQLLQFMPALVRQEIVHYHIAASGWIITGNRIQYMIHEIQ